jgi:hypothetical protein
VFAFSAVFVLIVSTLPSSEAIGGVGKRITKAAARRNVPLSPPPPLPPPLPPAQEIEPLRLSIKLYIPQLLVYSS